MSETALASGRILRLAKSDFRTLWCPIPSPGRIFLELGEEKRNLALPRPQLLLLLRGRPPVPRPIQFRQSSVPLVFSDASNRPPGRTN